MKLLAAIISTAALVSCAAKPINSSSDTLGSESSGGGQHTENRVPLTQNLIVYRKDDRPRDGSLVEIKLKRQMDSRYTITMRTASRSLQTGGAGENIELLGSGFTCADVKSTNPRVECRLDLRPADGELSVIEFHKNASGKFDSRLDQMSSIGTTSFRILATDLQRQDY